MILRRALLSAAAAPALAAFTPARKQLLLAPKSRVPPGLSLDLNFMTPGTLDPRITFTRASTASYFDSTGTLQTATTNTPRWDYNPATRALNGLLIEEARTNIFTQSGDFTQAAWTKTNCTLGAGTLGPNGAATGSGIISNNGVQGFLAQTFTPAAGTVYTSSCFAKAGTLSSVLLIMPTAWWADATARSCTFNLLTGVVSATNGGTASGTITPVGNGWYRVTLTATPDTAVSGTIQVGRVAANGNGVAVQAYAFGAQFEAGAFATSYIPTTAASATRAADVCTMPIGAWFNTAVGSASAEYMIWQSPSPFTINQGALCFSDGTASNRVALFALIQSSSNARVSSVVTGVAGANANVSPVVAGAVTKLAGAWNGVGDFASLNGAAVVSAANTMPAGINLVTIGNLTGASQSLYGHMRRVRYWPRALSNTELQQVTT